MGQFEIIIGAVGLLIAIWALNLQRKEIIKNGRITALIHASNLLQEKIEYYRDIVDDMKSQGKEYNEWIGTANRINNEFKPLKQKIDLEFIEIAAKYDGILHEQEIRKALQIPNANKAN
ncbi:MAG: hypothetical protein GY820_22505 [Gammaproteobacteria bacterium]|nr:hypothetical protein [Gammaproteobacteria bacterium]